MKTNTKAKSELYDTERLAGGLGKLAARSTAEQELRRLTMACLLWEDNAYSKGSETAKRIAFLIPQIDPRVVRDMAIEARLVQKLRHLPLYMAVCMIEAGGEYRKLVGELLPIIINRADELAETLALYYREGRKPLANQLKTGLAKSFNSFNEYQFAKWNRDNEIKLRDVMFMVHPQPVGKEQEELFAKIAEDTLETPDTWEVALSSGADKKASWERLLAENKLPALAFLRNLRNMEKVGVSDQLIRTAFEKINARWLLPINYISARKYAPKWEKEIEKLMFKGYAGAPKLQGKSIFVLDASGSMNSRISKTSEFSRLDVAIAMAMMAKEVCEDVEIYVTAGNDGRYTHKTMLMKDVRGFDIEREVERMQDQVGGGGIFTRQCLEYIKSQEGEKEIDRIIIFSDSADCDYPNKKTPAPFGKKNYIVDVSSERHGVNYNGVWTAEISGWSEHFIPYIMVLEGMGFFVDDE